MERQDVIRVAPADHPAVASGTGTARRVEHFLRPDPGRVERGTGVAQVLLAQDTGNGVGAGRAALDDQDVIVPRTGLDDDAVDFLVDKIDILPVAGTTDQKSEFLLLRGCCHAASYCCMTWVRQSNKFSMTPSS